MDILDGREAAFSNPVEINLCAENIAMLHKASKGLRDYLKNKYKKDFLDISLKDKFQKAYDELEINEGFLSLKTANTSETSINLIRNKMDYIKEIMNKHKLTPSKNWNVNYLAEQTNNKLEYKAFFKLYSKYVHPSSWIVNSRNNEYDNPVFKNIFILQGQHYASCITKLISEYLNDYYYMKPFIEKSDFYQNNTINTIKKQIYEFLAPRLSTIKYEHDALLRDNAIFVCIKDAVDQLSLDQSITALVCVNDLVAGLITDYWNFHQLSLENRPALIGFDNSFNSLQQQFSSYEFNTQGEIQDMITHVLYPENALFSRNKPVIRLSGKVIERRSSQRMVSRLKNSSI
jgi:hypothetical protein